MLQEVELYTISYKEWNMKKGKTKLVSTELWAFKFVFKKRKEKSAWPHNRLFSFLFSHFVFDCLHFTHCCCRGFAWSSPVISVSFHRHMPPHGIYHLCKGRGWFKCKIWRDYEQWRSGDSCRRKPLFFHKNVLGRVARFFLLFISGYRASPWIPVHP